jgi:acetyltransferase
MKLTAVFNPKSVAIVGASHTPGKVGYEVLKNLIDGGYQGKIFPVNPKGGQLLGQKVYAQLSQIPQPIDMVVVAIPAQLVLEVVAQAGQQQANSVVVISSGFKEAGNLELEQKLVVLCQRYHITLIGPNCLGLLNPKIKLNASFAPIMPQVGSIAFLSQSGALCSSVLDYADKLGLGFSKFISIGNKAMVGEYALLEYLYRDDQTKVIMMYVEDIDRAEELLELAETITRGKKHKPIIMLKSGRSEAGSEASASHTGSLGGNDQAYSALSRQSGIIRVDTISEMFELADVFSDNRYLLRDNKIAVITNAGGPGVIATDQLVDEGLELAEFSSATVSLLAKFLPASANMQNPVDILGDADAQRYQQALEVVLADANVDGILVILTPQSMTQVEDTARAIVKLKQGSRKPIVTSFMGEGLVAAGRDILAQGDVTSMSFPEPAAEALGALYDYRQWLKPKNQQGFRFDNIDLDKTKDLMAQHFSPQVLDVEVSFAVLRGFGFQVVDTDVIFSLTEARQLATKHKSSVVLKVLSPDISHKSDVGGVILNVSPDQLEKKYRQLVRNVRRKMPQAKITGVQVSPMIDDHGLDLILGIKTDPNVGKMILVGLGGIYTEVIRDTTWGVAPLSQFDARQMLKRLKAYHILKGVRGQQPLDIEALVRTLGRLSQFAQEFPHIKELDLNPVRVLPEGQGVVVLDARIVL